MAEDDEDVAGLVGAGVVVLLLLFFNGLLADLPNSALAAWRPRSMRST